MVVNTLRCEHLRMICIQPEGCNFAFKTIQGEIICSRPAPVIVSKDEKILDEVYAKMGRDHAFCEKHADESFGLPAADYYNSRSACLEFYMEYIDKLRKRGEQK